VPPFLAYFVPRPHEDWGGIHARHLVCSELGNLLFTQLETWEQQWANPQFINRIKEVKLNMVAGTDSLTLEFNARKSHVV
jgi:hypothetical protein